MLAAIILILVMAAIFVVLLATPTVSIANQSFEELEAREAATEFGDAVGWDATDVSTLRDETMIKMEGPLPLPDTDALRAELESCSIDPSSDRVELDRVTVIEYE